VGMFHTPLSLSSLLQMPQCVLYWYKRIQHHALLHVKVKAVQLLEKPIPALTKPLKPVTEKQSLQPQQPISPLPFWSPIGWQKRGKIWELIL